MKLSNKARYGIRAVFDIAFHNRGKATQIKDISERQDIPARFLEQIFQDLKRAGLITSKRGPKGGYRLAVPARDIGLGDIITALEGPLQLASPTTSGEIRGDQTSRAVTEEAFQDLAERIEASLADLTIEDLCERGEEKGLQRTPPRRYVYSI